ncbi:MAG TPA: recombination protein RecR [Papillibacter sp.]|jgi:recombination protein RecR|nr:recombination protein RecR [Papillibacter sp.]
MSAFPSSLEVLVEKFASLPGIGTKSAQRLAFHFLSLPDETAQSFINALQEAKNSVRCCTVCQNLTDSDVCAICSNPRRDERVICVVSDPKAVAAIERSHEFGGVYHVLHGVISPLNHIGPDDIRIKELVTRVAEKDVDEIIMATNPDTEGETTARYIARLLQPFNVRITRLAYGIPVGMSLEYADDLTLMRALEGRQAF